MTDMLEKICADKRRHVTESRQQISLRALEERARQQRPVKGFLRALDQVHHEGRPGLICEIKKASPSKGLIRENFDPAELAKSYQKGGATCLSVLTDRPYFQGHEDDLLAARGACDLPILRKDFMLDPYQVAEARALGADCILLIMAALSDAQADELKSAALDWDMDVLVEVHNQAELDRALDLQAPMIGINNRNLKTLEVSLETTVELAPQVVGRAHLVGESGLATAADLQQAQEVGVNSFLIGETFMRQPDVTQAVQSLLEAV